MILTSYLYVGVYYKKNNGVSSKLAPVNIVTLWIQVVLTNCCWKQLTYLLNLSALDTDPDVCTGNFVEFNYICPTNAQ
jgi:hypothetical protein